MTDEEFLAEFEACRLLKEQWHHRHHIKVAYLYLRQLPLEAAIERVRERIIALNAAHQTPESLTRGYHETLTQAWMRLVHLTLCEYGPCESADHFYEEHPELWEKKTLRLFYSRELATSLRAKNGFVEPDLAPLPKSQKNAFP